jgi:hypothetical protein
VGGDRDPGGVGLPLVERESTVIPWWLVLTLRIVSIVLGVAVLV